MSARKEKKEDGLEHTNGDLAASKKASSKKKADPSDADAVKSSKKGSEDADGKKKKKHTEEGEAVTEKKSKKKNDEEANGDTEKPKKKKAAKGDEEAPAGEEKPKKKKKKDEGEEPAAEDKKDKKKKKTAEAEEQPAEENGKRSKSSKKEKTDQPEDKKASKGKKDHPDLDDVSHIKAKGNGNDVSHDEDRELRNMIPDFKSASKDKKVVINEPKKTAKEEPVKQPVKQPASMRPTSSPPRGKAAEAPPANDKLRKGKSPEPQKVQPVVEEKPSSRRRGGEDRAKSQNQEQSPGKNGLRSPRTLERSNSKNSNLAEKLGLKKPGDKSADKTAAKGKKPNEAPDNKRGIPGSNRPSDSRPNTARPTDRKASVPQEEAGRPKTAKLQLEKSPEKPSSPVRKGAKEPAQSEPVTKRGEKPSAQIPANKAVGKDGKALVGSASTQRLASPKPRNTDNEFTAEDVHYLGLEATADMDFETRNKIWDVKKKAKILLGERENKDSEFKDCTFQPKTNVKNHKTKVVPEEFYKKSVDWLNRRKTQTAKKQEQIYQEEIHKETNKIRRERVRVKSMYASPPGLDSYQNTASITIDHGIIGAIHGHNMNRPTQESFFKLNKEKESMPDADLYIKKLILASPLSTDFGGVFSVSQTATKNRPIREEDSEELQQSSQQATQNGNHKPHHSTFYRSKVSPAKELPVEDEGDERLENLKQFLNVSKKSTARSKPAEEEDKSPLKKLQDKNTFVSLAKNSKKLLQKSHTHLQIKNNRYIVTEQPISPIMKEGDSHTMDSAELKAQVDVKETAAPNDREYVKGEAPELKEEPETKEQTPRNKEELATPVN